MQTSGHQPLQQTRTCIARPLIPGGSPSTNPAVTGAVPFPVLSPQNAPCVAGITISSTTHPQISPPQAVVGKSPLLPSGPGSIVRVPGSSPDSLLMASTTTGVPEPPGGPGLIIAQECRPVDHGIPNIPGIHLPPPGGTFVPGIQGTLRTPITGTIPPPLGVPPDSVQGVKRGGVLPPPIHLLGPGNPLSSHPFLDPAIIGSPSSQTPVIVGVPPPGVPPSGVPPPGVPPPGIPSSGAAPSGVPPSSLPPLDVWFQHVTIDGRTYYSHSQTRKTVWERPTSSHIVLQPPPGGPTRTSESTMPNCAPDLCGDGAILNFTSVPPNVASQPAPEWSQHQTPEGKSYFYNNVTQQSVWEKPVDFDSNVPMPVNIKGLSTENEGSEEAPTEKAEVGSGMCVDTKMDPVQMQAGILEKPDIKAPGVLEESSSIEPASVAPISTEHSLPSSLAGQSGLIPQIPLHVLQPPVKYQPPLVHAVVQPIISEPTAVKEEPAGPHPVKSIPIAGTPWSVVWSSDNRRFFFDATQRISVWNIPKDLESNPLVCKILDDEAEGKKRVGELKPASEAKRFKLADEEDDDDGDMETEDKEQTLVGLDEGSIAAKPKATTLLDEGKVAELKANKSLSERQREFKDMLLERGVSAFSTWEKELPKFVFDPRCKLLSVKERKACFEEYIMSRAEEERRERKSRLKEKREKFHSLLEEAKLHPKSTFSDFAFRYGKDERFKSVEKMREREQLYTDYLAEMKKLNKHKEHKSSKYTEDVVKVNFMAMLEESEAITERSQWKKIKTLFAHDYRYKAVESATQREEWFLDHVKAICNQASLADDRQERIQASLREREREVKMSRSAHEKEWNRERDQLRKSEALQHFKALLVDMVRTPDKSWNDTKRSLRKDYRWELAELLDAGEKEKLFQNHIDQLTDKKRIQFRQLLEENTHISLTMPWKKARKLVKEDPRYKNYGDTDHKREAEYDEYLKDRLVEAKNEFRALLKETKAISYRSYEMIKETDKHHKDIIDVLKNDRRYLVLECIADERNRMVESYIEELHRRGPPPPPTATNPGERLKRPTST